MLEKNREDTCIPCYPNPKASNTVKQASRGSRRPATDPFHLKQDPLVRRSSGDQNTYFRSLRCSLSPFYRSFTLSESRIGENHTLHRREAEMEDIEDIVAGGAPPGLRLPLMAVGMKPRKPKPRKTEYTLSSTHHIPGTQTIYVKTFGCSHNQSDSEYMAGQLSAFGYALSDNPEEADLWLINTCTVKSPSQSAMETLILKSKNERKPLVVAGCVPQGSRDLKELEGVSIIGVQQIDRVVEVVEETLKGHEVRLLNRSSLPALELPKVRKNKFIEILPINVGCLGACTYCKTKHARGHLGSYTVENLVNRVRKVISEGVTEIWLSSEDTGAYGRDIGVNLPILLTALVVELPSNGSVMLRIGMTNPPFILEYLKEIAKVLCHPSVYSFLHVPVQSGSDSVLSAMNREYTVDEFKMVADTLNQLVPDMQIATDIICGFPGETDEDFAQTISLIKEYKFPHVHISQFYPRPGTPAARMKKVPSKEVKKRSRELTNVFEAFTPYQGMEGRIERIWITETATDGIHLVGHTKSYVQVLVIAPKSMLGTSTEVRITSVGRWSVFAVVIEEAPNERKEVCSQRIATTTQESSPAWLGDLHENCSCSREAEACACAAKSVVDKDHTEGKYRKMVGPLRSLLLRKRNNRKQDQGDLEFKDMKEKGKIQGNLSDSDWVLLVGMVASFLTAATVLFLLGFKIAASK